MFDSSLAQPTALQLIDYPLTITRQFKLACEELNIPHATIQAANGTEIALKPVPDYNKLYPNFAIMKKPG
ncbi:MAG: hypothetical protein GXZ09_04885 [Syntrophomonadaceae bacterium]|jgi:hypothetical protein|nr:hypothetical protein [Syntrophomonadaceae bacterium]